MKISADSQRAISLILIYVALLFFLIGIAARLKSDFHTRLEISTGGFVIAAILASAGVLALLFSFTGKKP